MSRICLKFVSKMPNITIIVSENVQLFQEQNNVYAYWCKVNKYYRNLTPIFSVISITGPPGHFLPLFSQYFYIIRLLKMTHPIAFLDSSN